MKGWPFAEAARKPIGDLKELIDREVISSNRKINDEIERQTLYGDGKKGR